MQRIGQPVFTRNYPLAMRVLERWLENCAPRTGKERLHDVHALVRTGAPSALRPEDKPLDALAVVVATPPQLRRSIFAEYQRSTTDGPRTVYRRRCHIRGLFRILAEIGA